MPKNKQAKNKKIPPIPASSITITHLRPLEALRKGAPANTRLSVSRGARLKKQRSANLAPGHGNLPKLIREEWPVTPPKTLSTYQEQILTWAERNNSGDIPPARDWRMIVQGVI